MNTASARANKADGHGDNVPMTVADIDPNASAIEKAVVTGDLSCLTSSQRLEWYTSRCEAAGLDPRTQPFEYIVLKGKLKLYATKACTDQLIAIHQISLRIVDRLFHSELGLYEAQCEAKFPGGRTAEDIGVVDVYQFQGEQLANAIMKCFHPDTEVFTTNGWAKIATVTTGDMVAQYDRTSGGISFAHPIQTVETVTDTWIRIEDNISCQVVTPNHDVLVGGEKVEAGGLMAREVGIKRWRGEDQLPRIPVCGLNDADALPEKESFIRLMVAFICDGSYTPSESEISFGFHKTRKVERLRWLLSECDLPFTEHTYDVSHNTAFTATYETRTVFYVKSPAPWQLGQYLTGTKALTWKTVLAMDREQALTFMEEMQFWDGCQDDKGGIVFQQTEQTIVDAIQTLCVLNGIELSARRKESSSQLDGANPATRMRMSTATKRPLRRSRRSFQSIPNEDGMDAYCLEMPKGTLVTRFEGRVAISGNCVTKAKRRTVLSACGLGMMDETEVDTVPGAARVSVSEAHRAITMSDPSPGPPTGHGKSAAADRTHGEPIRHPSEGRRWMGQELSRRWDNWSSFCEIDKADPGKKIRINQVLNHLVKKWASDGAIEEADYKDDDGKQDNDKVAAIVRSAWDRRQADVKADVIGYLRGEIRQRSQELGIELDDDLDGDPIDPAEPEPASDGDTWEEGRE